MWWPASDSWYSTSRPPASSVSRARRAKSTVHDRVAAAVGDEHAGAAGAAREVGLPALDDRDEAREGEDAGRRRAVGPEAERVAHHRAHREAAEDGVLGRRRRSAPRARRAARRGSRRRRGTCRGRGSRRAGRRTSGSPASPAASAARGASRRAGAARGRARRRGRAGPARRPRGRDGGRAGRPARRRRGARGRSARSCRHLLAVVQARWRHCCGPSPRMRYPRPCGSSQSSSGRTATMRLGFIDPWVM